MLFFKKEELRELWPFYLGTFLIAIFAIMGPFFYIYFNTLSFSFYQIGLLFSAISLGMLLFQIPTGALADVFGRKISVLLGFFLCGITLSLLYFATNFYYVILIFFLYGVFGSLSSGSYESWVIDLIQKKKIGDFNSYFSKSFSIASLGFVLAGIFGAFIVQFFGIRIIFPVMGIGFFLAGFCLLFVREIKSKKKIDKSMKGISKKISESLKYAYHHSALFYLMLIGFVLVISSQLSSLMSWTPVLKEVGFPDYGFGYLWSITAFFGIFIPLLVSKFIKKDLEKKALIFVSICSLILGFLVIFVNQLVSFWIILILFGIVGSFENPISQTYFHRFIPSEKRATIASAYSMLTAIAAIIGLPLVGLLVDKIGGRYTIFISGLLSILVIILYLRIKEK